MHWMDKTTSDPHCLNVDVPATEKRTSLDSQCHHIAATHPNRLAVRAVVRLGSTTSASVN